MTTESRIVQVPNKLFTDRLCQHQLEFLEAFDSGQGRFSILEWHRGSYKTTTIINLLIRECIEYPRHKYVYVGPTQVQAREIVWDDPNMLPDALPDKKDIFWKRNEQKMTITFGNGSLLKIGGADQPDSWRGIDADGGACDEWALMKHSTWTEILEPIIARKPKAGCRKRFWIFIYTPKGPNHATMMFNIAACVEDEARLPVKGKADRFQPEWFASRLTNEESGIIAQEEIDRLLRQVEMGLLPLSFYEQEYQCRRVTDEERTLITSKMLAGLDEIEWDIYRDRAREIRRIVAIDPAFGGDLCSIKAFENGRELTQRGLHLKLTSEVAHVAKVIAEEIGTKNFIVDCIGSGKGVADDLANDVAGYFVQYFNSSEKATGKSAKYNVFADVNLYYNKKAEAVAYAASLVRRCEVESIVDAETKRQLVALSKYKVARNGRMVMVLNNDVKKVLGCSPDKGLCWVYGIWGLQYVDPIRNDDLDRYDEAMRDYRDRKRKARRPKSPMRMC